MASGQTVGFQQIDSLFHVQLGKIVFQLIVVKCAQIGMKVGGKVGVLFRNVTQQAQGLLGQLNCLGNILFTGCPAFQQMCMIEIRAASICHKPFQFADDGIHSRLVTVFLHIFKDIFQEQQVSRHIILLSQGNDALCGLEKLSVSRHFDAMEQADFSLSGARCMILGYGRIGKALQKMLLGLGAKVTVAARREESRLAAGRDSIPFCDLTSHLHEMQVIFNTVPARVLEKEELSCIPKDALLLELASPPYGMDLTAAGEMGLHAWGEWGIPGRYCPKSAANILFDYMDREALI